MQLLVDIYSCSQCGVNRGGMRSSGPQPDRVCPPAAQLWDSNWVRISLFIYLFYKSKLINSELYPVRSYSVNYHTVFHFQVFLFESAVKMRFISDFMIRRGHLPFWSWSRAPAADLLLFTLLLLFQCFHLLYPLLLSGSRGAGAQSRRGGGGQVCSPAETNTLSRTYRDILELVFVI